MRVHILCVEDWEGLFIDGKLISEGHPPLGEGDSTLFLLKMAEKYGFHSSDVVEKELTTEDSKSLQEMGNMPSTIDAFNGEYEAEPANLQPVVPGWGKRVLSGFVKVAVDSNKPPGKDKQ